jgi:hypothetical protein
MMMSKVTIFAYTLTLRGQSKTLHLAEKHNCRLIAAEVGGYGKINGEKTHLNLELVKISGGSSEEVVLKILRDKGLDLDHYSYKKKNRGFAVELLFTVTAGHECDFNAMYADCLEWLRNYYPECPIVHAVVHHDEGSPHMHVIIVPLVNGKLKADEVKGYKGVSNKRNTSLFDFLDKKYGLTFPVYLKGAEKKMGAQIAIGKYMELPVADVKNLFMQATIQSIHARPEPYLYALGVEYKEILISMKTTPT